METIILAGGRGSRIAEESATRPKPMVEIGGRPILWHIMKSYAAHSVTEFVICCGYRGYVIKEYFANYFLHMSNVTFDLANNRMEVHQKFVEPWRVTLVDTGENTNTGGRLKRVREYLGEEDFCMTYGDGVGNMDIGSTIRFHSGHGKLATLTATRQPGRFGGLGLAGDTVRAFQEKPEGDGGWINGGYFVLSPKALDYIEGDATLWERGPLQALSAEGELKAFLHQGFWQPMDTLRDKNYLEELWASGKAPWKVW